MFRNERTMQVIFIHIDHMSCIEERYAYDAGKYQHKYSMFLVGNSVWNDEDLSTHMC